jgi:hypothetical protein
MSVSPNSLPLALNRAEAERFLFALDPSPTASFTFAGFHDTSKDAKPWQRTTGRLTDLTWNKIVALNNEGYGIHVAVNAFRRYRRKGDLLATRAIWQECDTVGWIGKFPSPPYMAVSSSPGKFHRYWFTRDLSDTDHARAMAMMAKNFASDPNAVDITRVLRLPGTFHMKGTPHPVTVSIDDMACAWGPMDLETLVATFGELPPAPVKASSGVADVPLTDDYLAHLAKLLSYLKADEYKAEWIERGMSLHQITGGDDAGLRLWDEWSQASALYAGDDLCGLKWETFDGNHPIARGYGTLYREAVAAGYKNADGSPGMSWQTMQEKAELADDLPPPADAGSAAPGSEDPEWHAKQKAAADARAEAARAEAEREKTRRNMRPNRTNV